MAAIDPAALTDEQVARLKRELETSLARLAQEIERQIGRARVDADGRLVPDDPFNLELARRLLEGILDEYEALFGRADERLRSISADVIEAVGDVLQEQGITDQLSRPSEALLRAQAGDGLDKLTTVRGEQSAALRATVLELFRTNVNPTEAVRALQGELGTTLGRTLSLVDTTVMAVDRTLVTEQATGSGFEWFVFSGPLDTLTREWCADRVGKLFHVSELDEVPNDTGPNPPSAYGGGYHCRHRWDPVDEADVRSHPRWQGRGYDARGR